MNRHLGIRGLLGFAASLDPALFADILERPKRREKPKEPTNSAGQPLKRGDHCVRADRDRNPNKRHRRV